MFKSNLKNIYLTSTSSGSGSRSRFTPSFEGIETVSKFD